MKKVFLLIIIAVISVYASAQNTSYTVITSDSLSIRLEKLQRDYNYLLCDYELFRIKVELNELSQEVSIKSNSVLIDIYRGSYDRDIYSAYIRYYDAISALFDTQKEGFETTKKFVMQKATTSNFSDAQLSLIETTFKSVDSSIASMNTSLKYYKYLVDTYRDKR